MQANTFYTTTIEPSIPLTLCKKMPQNIPTDTQRALQQQGFEGLLGQVALIINAEGTVIACYIGQKNASDSQALNTAVSKLPAAVYHMITPLSDEAIMGWALAQYRFDRYKRNDEKPRILVVSNPILDALLPKISAIFHVRDLINTPANDLGPEQLSNTVAALAKKHQASFQQWIGDELLDAGFPAIHAVGRAASQAPRLLSLTWGHKTHPLITLVGKGVCFDSGGLDLKPASNMRLMKKDMGGAAQVIGLSDWLMTQKIPIRLQLLIPAVENAVSASAYRPGDIVNMRNGLSVEIENTDAEGRLVLADAITKACEEKPDLLIDFATLTGAARTAVGTEISALFSNRDDVANELTTLGERIGDPIWRLPLYAGYKNLFTSSIADIANASSSPYAGAIVAALFLQYFIPSDIPWIHFDIMAWNVTSKPGKPEGGEAMGILAVGEYLINRYAKR